MKNLTLLFNLLTILLFSMTFSSCQKELLLEDESSLNVTTPFLSPIEGDLKDLLECHNFDTYEALQTEEHVIVEDDIVISKSELERLKLNENSYRNEININELEEYQIMYDADPQSIEERQYVINKAGLVTMANIANISYYIDPSVNNISPGGADWVSAINTATTNWEAVADCKINFTQVTSENLANISFHADITSEFTSAYSCMANLSSTTIARAAFPMNGNIGRYISINNSYNGTTSLDNKRKSMRHEIGHTLGFRHNNAVAEGEDTNFSRCYGTIYGLNLLQGTPLNDAVSVMKQGLYTYALSTNDKKAGKYLYPDNYSVPTINSHTVLPGNPLRTVVLYVSAPGVTPYEVLVTRHSTSSSSILQTTAYYEPMNSSTNFSSTCPVGTWRFRVWRRNYGNYYTISSYRTITVQ